MPYEPYPTLSSSAPTPQFNVSSQLYGGQSFVGYGQQPQVPQPQGSQLNPLNNFNPSNSIQIDSLALSANSASTPSTFAPATAVRHKKSRSVATPLIATAHAYRPDPALDSANAARDYITDYDATNAQSLNIPRDD